MLLCVVLLYIVLQVVPYFEEPVGQVKIQATVVNRFINEKRESVTVLCAGTDLYGKQVFYCTNTANRLSQLYEYQCCLLLLLLNIWMVFTAVG